MGFKDEAEQLKTAYLCGFRHTFVRHPGQQTRAEFKANNQGLIYAEVQVFAEAGAPTHLVVLGEQSHSPASSSTREVR